MIKFGGDWGGADYHYLHIICKWLVLTPDIGNNFNNMSKLSNAERGIT